MEISTNLILLFIPIVLVQFGLFLAALISVLRKEATGSEKLPWALLCFVSIIGPIIYFAIGSAKLDEKAAQRGDSQ